MPDPTPTPAPSPAPAPASGASKLDRLIARHGGDAKRALASALEESERRRKQIETARAAGTITVESAELARERDDLQRQLDEVSGRLPPAGAVILAGDDAAAWTGYKALNLAPDKVKEALTERETLKTQAAQRARADSMREAAEKVGWKPNVTADILTSKGLIVEMREVTVEVTDAKGAKSQEKQQRPHVKKADADASVQPEELTAYAARELADYLPALTAASGTGTPKGTAASGVTYPPQSTATSSTTRVAPESAAVKQRLAQTYSLPASLKPKDSAAAR